MLWGSSDGGSSSSGSSNSASSSSSGSSSTAAAVMKAAATEAFSMSLAGATCAAFTGAVLGGGWSLLRDDDSVHMSKVQRKTLGGALVVLGLYLGRPAGLRRAWLSGDD